MLYYDEMVQVLSRYASKLTTLRIAKKKRPARVGRRSCYHTVLTVVTINPVGRKTHSCIKMGEQNHDIIVIVVGGLAKGSIRTE